MEFFRENSRKVYITGVLLIFKDKYSNLIYRYVFDHNLLYVFVEYALFDKKVGTKK